MSPIGGREGRPFDTKLSSFSLGRQPSSRDGADGGVVCSVRPPPFSKVPPDTNAPTRWAVGQKKRRVERVVFLMTTMLLLVFLVIRKVTIKAYLASATSPSLVSGGYLITIPT